MLRVYGPRSDPGTFCAIRKQFMKKAILRLRFWLTYIKIGKDMKIRTKE